MREIHLKIRPIIQNDWSILNKRLRVLGLLRDLLKNEKRFCDLLMDAYDVGGMELKEYRKLDQNLFEKLKNRLRSRGWDEKLASQAIIVWGKVITDKVDFNLDNNERNTREKYYKERREGHSKHYEDKWGRWGKSKELSKEQKGESILTLLAKAKLGLLDEDSSLLPYEDSALIPLDDSSQVRKIESREIVQKSDLGARECDLEWLFDYTINIYKNNNFFHINVYDDTKGGNEGFVIAEMAYKIARGKLDVLQGKESVEAVLTAQLYIKHNPGQTVLDVGELDGRIKEYYLKLAKDRFEFDKPNGFRPPTDEEMKSYARQISYKMINNSSNPYFLSL